MVSDIPKIVVLALFLVLTVLAFLRKAGRINIPRSSYIYYLWAFFLFFVISDFLSFKVGIWILAVISFLSLREYFSMVDIRLQDRWAVLGAYLSIPFMIHYILIEWYGLFIISIPVYAFLVVPFLITLGGKEVKGSILSTGIIDLGLFLFVYCIGHIGYLALFSTFKAVMLILAVALCDINAYILKIYKKSPAERFVLLYAVTAPQTLVLTWVLSPWTGIPYEHSVVMGFLIPFLVAMGRHTMDFLMADLGVDKEKLRPGRGEVIASLRSFLYTAPAVFHYIRYFLT
jgi:phosphatidate cytidylyltransferase